MMKRRWQQGFTLLETVIAVALVGILVLILMAVQKLFVNENGKLINKLESSVDTMLGERVLYLDFRGVNPSFNNLRLPDDNGNDFFDYYPDIPENVISQTKKDRTLILQPGKNVFYLLYQDVDAGPMLNYDPVAAYEVGPIPANFNLAASLTYKSVNHSNWIASQRPRFWQQGKLLFLDTNVSIRKSVPLNLAEAPYRPAFLGAVDLSTNQLVGTNLTPYLKSTYNDVDLFFRELPSRGGGQPVVKLRAVKFYRYYLQIYRDDRVDGTPSRLIREEYVNGKFDRPLMMSDRVRAVRFSRESVLNKVVRFSIEKLHAKEAR